MRGIKTAMLVAALGLTTSRAEAQGALEVRGGINVPTFDITDAAKAGPSFGVGLNYRIGERVWVIGDADFGFHPGAELTGGSNGPDVNVYHYIAKLGYEVVRSADSRFTIVLNAGAGAMTFAVDGGDSFTYPAINVGAKLIYGIGSRVSLVLSPQGDIAFTDEDVLGTSNAWVWPVAAGFRVNF